MKTKGGLGRPVGGERYTRASRLVRHRAELGDAVVGEPVGLEHAPRSLAANADERVSRGRKTATVSVALDLGNSKSQPLRAAHRAR